MVARPGIIKESDVKRILAGAEKAGVRMSIIVSGQEVRFVPVDELDPEQKLSALDQWRAKRDARKTKAQDSGRSRSQG